MIRHIVYSTVRRILEFFFIRIMGIRVEGRENIPDCGPLIAAPNHCSNWDPPIVGIAVNSRLVHYMAKEELFHSPVIGAVFRYVGAFPVKRGSVDRTALRCAMKILKQGEVLGIFPEGTRIRNGHLGPFHSGMASIALMTGTPILPIAVVGTKDLPRRTGPTAVIIGEPIPVKRQRATEGLVKEVNELVSHTISGMIQEYQRRHENL